MQALFEKRDAALGTYPGGPRGGPIVELRDFSQVTGLPPKEVRAAFAKGLESSAGKIVGFAGFGGPGVAALAEVCVG